MRTTICRRRSVLAGLGAIATGITVTGAPTSLRANTNSLGEIAASRGFLYGSPIRLSSLATDRVYSEIVDRECTLYVCAEMHWRLVAPNPESTNFSIIDAAYKWASEHAKKFRGHALVWHAQTPAWFAELPDRTAAEQALTHHIRTMCRHFAGRVQSWDVVNEAIQNSGRPDGLRKTVFLEKIGPEYIDIAFRTAREADPRALLVLNEFDIEYDIPDHRNRQRYLLNLIDGLQRRRVPIDAIGFQSHLNWAKNPYFNPRLLADYVAELTNRGLKIMVTEMDVVDRGAPSSIAIRDAEVAAIYKRYLEVMLENRALVAVITWGLTDRDSWITRGDKPAFRRTDGLPPRPLPFDAEYEPKPCYYAIAQAFQAAPVR